MQRQLIAALVILTLGLTYSYFHKARIYIFPDVVGPTGQSIVPPPTPLSLQPYSQGSDSRMAILLTDKNSLWIGLVHGLKSIGIPFLITTDYKEAIKHKVIYIYPSIEDKNVSPEAMAAITAFVDHGGTLIAQNALSDSMKSVLGFDGILDDTKNTDIHFNTGSAATAGLTDPAELNIRIGNKETPITGSYEYRQPKFPPIATFEDGNAAIIHNKTNNAYGFAIDVGYFLLVGYDNRQVDISTHYVNEYEPMLDVWLRIIKNIYLQGEQNGVTLATVPEGKSLSVLITHDIDYTKSLVNAVAYAGYERIHDVNATYFMQTKYIRDWNDDVFFNKDGLKYLEKLRGYDMEIASHSIAHSRQFAEFPMGDGKEQYPTYVPFVKDKMTTVKGSILGELRVSKFLIEHFLPGLSVNTFRPGHLSNPYTLPEALTGTGYLYSSSVTADDSLTHLPFQLMRSRDFQTESPIYEFPLTVEDEADGPMINRLPQAIALAKKLETYGGVFNILIHPDIIEQKFDFEKGFITAMGHSVWYGTVGQMGQWWSARDKIGVDVSSVAGQLTISLSVPTPIHGLALDVPTGMTYASSVPKVDVTQTGNRIFINQLTSDTKLILTQAAH